MKAHISASSNKIAVPIKDKTGKTVCTVFLDPSGVEFKKKYRKATGKIKKIGERLINISINADGSPADSQYVKALNKAERETKQIIKELYPMDNDYLLEIRRPFASVKGDFYCTHVLTLLQNAFEEFSKGLTNNNLSER